MTEKKFHREEYPLDILAEFGLSEQSMTFLILSTRQ